MRSKVFSTQRILPFILFIYFLIIQGWPNAAQLELRGGRSNSFDGSTTVALCNAVGIDCSTIHSMFFRSFQRELYSPSLQGCSDRYEPTQAHLIHPNLVKFDSIETPFILHQIMRKVSISLNTFYALYFVQNILGKTMFGQL